MNKVKIRNIISTIRDTDGNSMKLIPFLLLACTFISCAGPTNPFGGDILISENFEIGAKQTVHRVPAGFQFGFSPGKQYYNSPYDLRIQIVDPKFRVDKFRYEIVYNDKKLNRWFKTETIKFPKNKKEPIEITFKNLSLLPGNINKIAFLYYPIGSRYPIVKKLSVPECFKDFKSENLNITPFAIKSKLKENIELLSDKYGYNSSLIAALIAQESSFNPRAISFAKALGLTQVTPNAHREIKKLKTDWEIYPQFAKMDFSKLKKKVIKREINSTNDWRLDQEKSIEGGILYLNYLTNYWSTPEKKEILETVFQSDVPTTDILLASYNSGAYRVKKSILKNKENWLFDSSLNEARKYVMNIKSYCYSFNQEVNNEK